MIEQGRDLQEQANLVAALSRTPGVRLDGRVEDRLGREGMMFSAIDGEYRHVLVISDRRGMLAYERYGSDDAEGSGEPAVLEYRLWN